jgi:hypothetical protein
MNISRLSPYEMLKLRQIQFKSILINCLFTLFCGSSITALMFVAMVIIIYAWFMEDTTSYVDRCFYPQLS